MSFTVNTKTYNEDSSPTPNAVRYRGPNQSFSVVDNVELKRTAPKKTGTYAGNARGGVRTTRSAIHPVTGEVLVAYIDTNSSLPVGFPAADATALRADHGALISGAVGDSVIEDGVIKL